MLLCRQYLGNTHSRGTRLISWQDTLSSRSIWTMFYNYSMLVDILTSVPNTSTEIQHFTQVKYFNSLKPELSYTFVFTKYGLDSGQEYPTFSSKVFFSEVVGTKQHKRW